MQRLNRSLRSFFAWRKSHSAALVLGASFVAPTESALAQHRSSLRSGVFARPLMVGVRGPDSTETSLAPQPLGAHLVGTSMGRKAPLWATSLGGLIGTVPLIALCIDEPYLPLFGLALGWIPQAALTIRDGNGA